MFNVLVSKLDSIKEELEELSELKQSIKDVDEKLNVHTERLVVLEAQQKFIEGTFKQYKEDIKTTFDVIFDKIREIPEVYSREREELKEWVKQETKNSIKDLKIWLLVPIIGFMVTMVLNLLNKFLR